MIFADASALIAIIAQEPEALALSAVLQTDPVRSYSALGAWETVAGLCRSYAFSAAAARARTELFLDALGFELVTIGKPEFEIASDAYARFGKGRHPAQLNMGDCFAYACAKTNDAKVLFTGNDFAKTDIAVAR